MILAALALAFTSFPVDQAARNSFPNNPPALIDKIAYFNKFVNASLTYEEDEKHYGFDKWVTWPADLKGDCEDYALTKMQLLQASQFDVIARTRVRTVWVNKKLGHAVLEVRLDDGSIAVLDNNFMEPMRRQELERTYGYKFFDW